MDRPVVAGIVFGDDAARRDLEAITHPRIGERIEQRIVAAAAAEAADGRERVVVVDHPLLVESGAAAGYPVVIVVTAPVDVRVHRLVEHRGMDADDARARIRAQVDDESRLAVATHVIDNSGEPDETRQQVEALAVELGLVEA